MKFIFVGRLLKDKGINDNKVLNAIDKVPRHLFMDPALQSYSYLDRAFPIASGQTISQPYTVAFQTQLLEVKRGEKVFEIGNIVFVSKGSLPLQEHGSKESKARNGSNQLSKISMNTETSGDFELQSVQEHRVILENKFAL